MDNIFSPNLLLLLKIFLLVLIFGYAVFSFVVVSQVVIMNRLFQHTLVSSLVFLIALTNLIVAGFLFLLSIAIL